MADPITAEQVARAIRCAKAGVDGITVALGGFSWPDYAPGYVTELWHRVSLPTSDGEFVAALTRWHAELVAAETPRKAPDDTAPERLRERRERLGWTPQDAADAISRLPSRLTGRPVPWRLNDVMITESEGAAEYAQCRAHYAAVLSAAEAERAAKPDPLAYADSPAWDDGPMPKPERAPEVVDVPQPIVKRCACSDIHDDVEATWQSGEPYLTVTHTTVPVALLRAMLAAIDAQQGGPPKKWGSLDWLDEPEPTRPEPRYKVGDWVRVEGTGTVYQIGEIAGEYFRKMPGSASVSYKLCALTPALDPALHETARRAVAMLHKGEWPLDVPRVEDLPGFDEWNSGGMGSPSWAAQLERLLGDAP